MNETSFRLLCGENRPRQRNGAQRRSKRILLVAAYFAYLVPLLLVSEFVARIFEKLPVPEHTSVVTLQDTKCSLFRESTVPRLYYQSIPGASRYNGSVA